MKELKKTRKLDAFVGEAPGEGGRGGGGKNRCSAAIANKKISFTTALAQWIENQKFRTIRTLKKHLNLE